MRFTLTIELGNDAMQDYGDLALAVQKLARKLNDMAEGAIQAGDDGKVFDLNGNNVGTWEVSSTAAEAAEERTRIGNTPEDEAEEEPERITLEPEPPPPAIYGHLGDAQAAARDTDYLYSFESIATGTKLYAIASDPASMKDKKRAVILRHPIE